MSMATINGANTGKADSEHRRTWAIACTDTFGRDYEMTITAYRGGCLACSPPGIGVQSPTGEYAFVHVNRVGDLSYVLNEAKRFLSGVGV